VSSDANTEFPTIIGPDANFKGELTFEKGVRIQGGFEGKVETQGTLHIAEGARVNADIESGDLRVDGELKGNVLVRGKITLNNSARMEGDLRTNRIEMADGAVFVGNVVVGHQAGAGDNHRRDTSSSSGSSMASASRPTTTSEPVKPRPAPDPSAISVPPVTIPQRS
jgi:cytoskeletal protein CcmA (bactofilin family)